uniref:Uncharacterized protein n=1 Tax=Plectus sambesii TaxID=2011161 RepID=A0A914VIX8_9BILA
MTATVIVRMTRMAITMRSTESTAFCTFLVVSGGQQGGAAASPRRCIHQSEFARQTDYQPILRKTKASGRRRLIVRSSLAGKRRKSGQSQPPPSAATVHKLPLLTRSATAAAAVAADVLLLLVRVCVCAQRAKNRTPPAKSFFANGWAIDSRTLAPPNSTSFPSYANYSRPGSIQERASEEEVGGRGYDGGRAESGLTLSAGRATAAGMVCGRDRGVGLETSAALSRSDRNSTTAVARTWAAVAATTEHVARATIAPAPSTRPAALTTVFRPQTAPATAGVNRPYSAIAGPTNVFIELAAGTCLSQSSPSNCRYCETVRPSAAAAAESAPAKVEQRRSDLSTDAVAAAEKSGPSQARAANDNESGRERSLSSRAVRRVVDGGAAEAETTSRSSIANGRCATRSLRAVRPRISGRRRRSNPGDKRPLFSLIAAGGALVSSSTADFRRRAKSPQLGGLRTSLNYGQCAGRPPTDTLAEAAVDKRRASTETNAVSTCVSGAGRRVRPPCSTAPTDRRPVGRLRQLASSGRFQL